MGNSLYLLQRRLAGGQWRFSAALSEFVLGPV